MNATDAAASDSILHHADNGLVIFCGAGVSMLPPTCLPSWWEMNEQVVQALSRQVEPFCGQERAAELVREINARRDSRRFPPEFQAEIISNHYGADYFRVLECLDAREPNAMHLSLAALARSGHVRAIVTSNFDRLIEVAFGNLGVPLDVYFQARHFEALARELEQGSPQPGRCRLLKLHGSVDDHLTLVDTLAQRMRGFSPAICSCLRLLLRSHYWLFLGYSGADLEGNSQYLCLRSEVEDAVGFSWLVRKSAQNAPIEAVVELCQLYGDRADAPRGELPAWFVEKFASLVPEGFPAPPVLSEEELALRKHAAAQAIVHHTREWSEKVGGVHAALILAAMLEQAVSNPQAARELLTHALKAEERNDHAYTALANALSNVLAHQGSLAEARSLAEKALTRTDPGHQRERIAVLTTLGLIDQELGKYQVALERFEQAYESSATLQDEDLKSVSLHNRAMSLSTLGRNDEAIACYHEALEIVQGAGDAMAQATTLNNIGDLLRKQDRFDEAVIALNQSISLRERLGDDRGVARCLGNIAAANQVRGKFEDAQSTYERILAIFRRLGDRSNEVTTKFNLGKLAEERGKLEEAERSYREALALAIEGGMEPQRANGLGKLASLYRVSSRSTEARPLFDEALAIYRQQGDKSGEADVLNDLGILILQTGELEVAARTFERAIGIRESLGQEAGVCEAVGNLALVFQEKGDPDKALELLRRKLAIAERLNARSLIANAHYNIGVVLHRQEDSENALKSLEIAQRLYQETTQLTQAIDILAVMGEIRGRQGKIGASLELFDRAICLATEAAQRTSISKRLANILMVLLENGYEELGKQYVQRLEAMGAQVAIEKH